SAAGWQAGGVTLAALRGIVHAMRGWPTPVGIAINSIEQKPFAADGSLKDESVACAVELQAKQIMSFRLAEAARCPLMSACWAPAQSPRPITWRCKPGRSSIWWPALRRASR